jgi:hypothetical protein
MFDVDATVGTFALGLQPTVQTTFTRQRSTTDNCQYCTQAGKKRTLRVASTFELHPPHFIPSTLMSSSTVLPAE